MINPVTSTAFSPSLLDTLLAVPASASGASASAATSPTSSGTSSQASPSGTNGLLAPNQFLSLLVDSLKYQNPLDPTSSAQFLSQLAALSQVQSEQQISQTDQASAATALIGKTVAGPDLSGTPISGVVSGYSLTSTGPILDIGTDAISLGSVTSVDAGSTSGSATTTAPTTTSTTAATGA